ncbi:CPBP family intramembrane glutamic endopeptidase [Ferruginibacter sp. HRS2-29]|uniref:CPBP family intramembrane glutamic endopeptidase n=1 Tax=Ferruginibacter sp. HRS2-29 TaxID=2487334 RepID=UPI0020CC0BCD|nr:type II CAAX endopeptidase family protein [Ferruginibacter sp. HRS2-29]MCP9751963.1 CPBP family intramembrane metalloprotease [Ferruginibacter sp. HRS2-29]
MITKHSLIIKFIPSIVLLAAGFYQSNGLLVQLSISWVLLSLFDRKDPRALGLLPTTKTTTQVFVGFAIAIIICAFNYYLQTVFSGSTWLLNKAFTWPGFFSGSWWVMQSVLYEELIFRGALLYIAIKKIGAKKACMLSAICFGVYHWFSMGAFGNWVSMACLFIGTGIMGYIFALAFAKTRSMYLPIGLHFGWNFINTIIFSQGPIGDQLLISKRGDRFNVYESIIVTLVQFVVFPLAAFIYIKIWKGDGDKQIVEYAQDSLAK